MKFCKITWTKRPACVIEAGPQVSVIEWLDSGMNQALANDQIKVVKSDLSYADLLAKYRPKKAAFGRSPTAGPSKLSIAIDVVKGGGSRQDLITAIMKACSMSKAGASTYYYNAKKAIG